VAAVTEETTDDPAQVGRVISMFPPGGSRVSAGHRDDLVGIASPTTTTTTAP
jgi:hypothetical protein